DYKLVLDLRRFDASYDGRPVPSANIELSAKLLHASQQHVVASRTFARSIPATGTSVPEVVGAFDRALHGVTAELAGWVLSNGNGHATHTLPAAAPVVPSPWRHSGLGAVGQTRDNVRWTAGAGHDRADPSPRDRRLRDGARRRHRRRRPGLPGLR